MHRTVGYCIAAFIVIGTLASCHKATQASQNGLPNQALNKSFNLECDLKTKIQVGAHDKPMRTSLHKVVRIDLSAARWCELECKETKPIIKFDDAEILLISDADPRIDAYEQYSINRESGRLTHNNRINETSYEEEGICRRAAFSGLPARKF